MVGGGALARQPSARAGGQRGQGEIRPIFSHACPGVFDRESAARILCISMHASVESRTKQAVLKALQEHALIYRVRRA